jgi:hypothetical protein
MRLDTVYNAVEIVLWTAVGVGFAVRAVRNASYRTSKIIAAAAFMVFAASDGIEIWTGAWWRPWCLLAVKAACIVTLAALLIVYLKGRVKEQDRTDDDRS